MINFIKKLYQKSKVKKAIKEGLTVGKNFYCYGCDFGSEPYLITIGDNVKISSGVSFITHDGGISVFKTNEDVIKYGRINVGNNVFIGFKSTILPGVKIGDNCVIGANSVVTKDIPNNSVYAGNPAHFISSIDDYEAKARKQSPCYDRDEYKRNKKEYLKKIIK